MKKILLLALFVLLALGMVVMPVLAEAPVAKARPARVLPNGRPFVLLGRVVTVDASAGTITVKVITGNRQVKDAVGRDLTVATGQRTRFVSYTDPREVIDLGDVQTSDIVVIQGTYRPALAQPYLAGRVVVDVPFAAP